MRGLIREHVWVSAHLSLDDYMRLPRWQQMEYLAAAQEKRESLRAANPFSGGED